MKKPKVVCLCGSTRFFKAFEKQNIKETLNGNIVLSVGCMTQSDKELGLTEKPDWPKIKKELDKLHLRKIDMADEVMILNVDGYIGESTSRELVYARLYGKPVKFLEEHNLEKERLIMVDTDNGSYVYSANGDNHLEDIRLLLSEGFDGDSVKITLYEVEKGMYDKLPMD